jgi:hypothetical protein
MNSTKSKALLTDFADEFFKPGFFKLSNQQSLKSVAAMQVLLMNV